ncbi:cysteine hydrolase family protein [Brevibacillus halotolerans]|uniref:cysteine hydrolase family protein n=1 Tax=Brevibacillus halotolerans TaxID=1507437 RepID=UPI0015EF2BB7|nr:cysteine hydrolase family protein [Brevibacillus halotolerans]MBA4533033.1 cysteine hydrolase [Brevibacillus halotolerans]
MIDKTALVIVDTQSIITYHSYHGEEIVDKISSLQAKARQLNVPVLFIQHIGPAGSPFEEGAHMTEIHPNVAPLKGEIVIKKTACDAFYETALHQELLNRGIEHLIIVGFQTQFCIDTACRSAVSHGYEVTLVGDCHSTANTPTLNAISIIDHHNETLNGLGTQHHNITVKDSSEIFASEPR